MVLTLTPRRLEAATSRLEDIASSTEVSSDVAALEDPSSQPANVSTIASLPVAPSAPAPAPKPAADPLPETIEDFDSFLNTSVDKYVQASNELGGLVAQQVGLPWPGGRFRHRHPLHPRG